jgi:hypothetical protein
VDRERLGAALDDFGAASLKLRPALTEKGMLA